MSALAVGEFEARLEQYGIERSEEARAVRVGEKETSEQAAIVARYADLFTRDQLEALRAAEAEATGADQESVARLRLECQEGLVDRELAEPVPGRGQALIDWACAELAEKRRGKLMRDQAEKCERATKN